MKCCCVCSSTDTHFKRLTTNVIHPPGHVLQLNVSKGFVALRSNICQNTSFFSFLTSFKPKLLCLSLFLPVHCFMCQHTDTHTQGKFAVPKPESDNISFRTIVAETSDCIETVDDAWAKLHDFSTFRNFIFSHLFRRFKIANKPRACWSPAATHCVCAS